MRTLQNEMNSYHSAQFFVLALFKTKKATKSMKCSFIVLFSSSSYLRYYEHFPNFLLDMNTITSNTEFSVRNQYNSQVKLITKLLLDCLSTS